MSENANPADLAGDAPLPDEIETAAETEAVEEGQVEDPPAEPDEDESPSDEEKSRSKERRERRKAHVRELERKEADARARLERIKSSAESETAPAESDFDDLTEYSIAKAAWSLGQKAAEREAAEVTAEAQRAAQERDQEALGYLREQMDDARTRYGDYDQVVMNPAVQISPQVMRLIAESDAAGDLAYAIASDPQKAAFLSRTDPIAAAREIGRLEASLSRPRPRTQTAAPEPIKPVRATSGASKSPEAMTMAEYRAWRTGKS